MSKKWYLIPIFVSLLSAGCESASENAGSTAGPGVDVRCLVKKKANLYPGQGSTTGVGDTDVEVQCAPS
jgi:hypothetical protein